MWKQQHGKPGPAHDNRCDDNHPNEGQDHNVGHHNPDCNHNTTTSSTPQVTVPGSTVVVTFPVKHTTTTLVQIGDAASVSSSTTAAVGVAKELPNTGGHSGELALVGGGSAIVGMALMAFAAKSALIRTVK